MKGRLKKWAVAATAALMAFTALGVTGCGPKKTPDNATDIEIMFWRSGVGDEFIRQMADDFQALNPQYKVHLDVSDSQEGIGAFGRGSAYDTVDLYICPIVLNSAADTIKQYAEPLDTVLSTPYGDESVPLIDKFDKTLLDSVRFDDGKVYALTYGGGWIGLAYDTDVIDGEKYEVPRTTWQLEDLVIALSQDVQLKRREMEPFIDFGGSYSNNASITWQIQYDGLDYYRNTFMPLDGGPDDPAPSKAVLVRKDGRYAMLKEAERIFKYDYMDPGSNSWDYITAQTRFLHDQAVMMFNGSWLMNEMKNDSTANQNKLMMKMPVISSIIETAGCETIADDDELAALVDAVDAATAPDEVPLKGAGYDVDRAAVERIYEARNLLSNNFYEHTVLVPNYATAKEGALEFLRYFYSDAGLQTYWNATHLPLPITDSHGNGPDTSNWTAWEKGQERLASTAISFSGTPNLSPLFSRGGAQPYAESSFMYRLIAQDAKDRWDAEMIWNNIVTTHNERFETYKLNAGLV